MRMPAAANPPTADSRDATLRRLLHIAWSYRSDCLQLAPHPLQLLLLLPQGVPQLLRLSVGAAVDGFRV